MTKQVTNSTFNQLVAEKMRTQIGALCSVVGGMRPVPGCDMDLMDAAQSELARFRGERHQWERGEIEDFNPLDRELLSKAWADWYVACGVAEYGWIDCRSASLVLPKGYALVSRSAQEGVLVSIMDDRNPKYPGVVGRYLVNDAGCWTGRDFSRLMESPQAAIDRIMGNHQQFEAAREASLDRRLGVPA